MQNIKQLLYRYRYFVGIVVLVAAILIVAFQIDNRPYGVEIGDAGIIKSGPARESLYYDEYLKAESLLRANRIIEAAGVYSDLIEKEPAYSDPYIGLAVCRRLLEDYEGAIELYNKALTINPVSIRAMFGLGSMNEKLDNNTTAIRFYKKVLNLNKDDADTHAALAQVYSKIGEIIKAKQHLNRFMELAPDSIYVERLEKIVNGAD